jgi:hypothetical protein
LEIGAATVPLGLSQGFQQEDMKGMKNKKKANGLRFETSTSTSFVHPLHVFLWNFIASQGGWPILVRLFIQRRTGITQRRSRWIGGF